MTYNILYRRKKIAIFHPKAEEEFNLLGRSIQAHFRSIIKALEINCLLREPEGKKLKGYKNLFEIRVRVNNQWRGFYGYLKNDEILIVHFTNKKTQKTPLKIINLAIKRLKDYE